MVSEKRKRRKKCLRRKRRILRIGDGRHPSHAKPMYSTYVDINRGFGLLKMAFPLVRCSYSSIGTIQWLINKHTCNKYVAQLHSNELALSGFGFHSFTATVHNWSKFLVRFEYLVHLMLLHRVDIDHRSKQGRQTLEEHYFPAIDLFSSFLPSRGLYGFQRKNAAVKIFARVQWPDRWMHFRVCYRLNTVA